MVTHISRLTIRSLRFLSHATALALLTVGIPVVLVFTVGWPLPDQTPDPSAIWRAVQQQNIPAEVVINTLAVLAWILWAQLAWAILWDLAINTRQIAAGAHLRPAPFVVASIDSLATRLVSGTMAISVVMSSPAAVSALPTVVLPVAAQEYVEVAPSGDITAPAKPVVASTESTRPIWRVLKADSAWSIAEIVLGDGSRFGEIAQLNDQISTARDVIPGIRLVLPAGSEVPVDRLPSKPVAPLTGHGTSGEAKTAGTAFEQVEQPSVPGTVTVVKGDHLWGIATDRLTTTTGETPTDIAVSAYVQRLIALNPDVAEDPDLIFPGETFRLPTTSTNQPEVAGPVTSLGPTDGEHGGGGYLPSVEVTIERFDHLWGLSDARLQQAHDREPSNLEILNYVNTVIDLNTDIVEDPDLIFPGEVFTLPAIGTPTPTPQPEVAVEEQEPETPIDIQPTQITIDDPKPELPADTAPTQTESSRLAHFAGITGALVTATGLLAVHRALRRRRASFGEAATASQTTELERAMMNASDMPLLRWAGQEISTLVEQVDPNEVTSGPVLVEVSEKGMELLWDSSQDKAPHPWEATDGGAAWRLLYDPEAPIPADELPAGIPALVTLGIRPDGGTVLADLEAFGSLSVTGDQAMTENTLRSFALELGSSEELSNVGLVTVGIDVDGSESLNRIQAQTETDALDQIKTTVSQFEEMIEQAGVSESFGLRAKTGVGPSALVVLVSADRCGNLGELIGAVQPRRGVALVIAGDVPSAGAKLDIEADGTGILNPLGLGVKVASMPRETASQVSVLLDQASILPDEEESGGLADDDVWEMVMSARTATTAETPEQAEPESEAGTVSRLIESEKQAPFVMETTDSPNGTGHPMIEEQVEAPEELVDLDVAGEILGGDAPDASQTEGRVVVSVLGVPHVAGFPELTARQVALLGFLASSPDGAATPESVLNHLWADSGSARSRKTLANLESQTRGTVGLDVLPNSPRNQPLRTSATTDYVLFCDLVTRSKDVSRNESVGLLTEALGLIRGTPFDHPYCEWSRSIEIYDPARQMIEATALRLTDLALEAGDAESAREGVRCGLLALGVNEPLYRARMRVDAFGGDVAGVISTYQELERQLALFFDDASPSIQTRKLRDSFVPAH